MQNPLLAENIEALWKRYAIALSLILAMVVSSHLLEFHALKSARQDAALINTSGKQRMLSQQMILLAQRYVEDGDVSAADLLQAKIDAFESSHEELLIEASASLSLLELYSTGRQPLDPMVRHHIQVAREIAQATEPKSTDLEALYDTGTGPLLIRLDDAVSEFQAVADRRSQQIQKIQEATLFMAVLVIVLVGLLIFLPVHRIVSRSVTMLRQEIEEHQTTNKRMSNFVNVAADLYWETDLAGRIVHVEGRFLERMKGTRDDLLGCQYSDIVSLGPAETARMASTLESVETYENIQGNFVDADGVAYVLNLTGMPRFDDDGKILGYLGKADNVTENVNFLDEVTRLALTDSLTEIGNKRAFEGKLKTAIDQATDTNPISLLALDLDQFKPINDTYGHGTGDQVLKIVAKRIQSALRADDWVARIGGDEFCIICKDSNATDITSTLAERLRESIGRPMKLPGGPLVEVGVSIGIAEAPLHAESVEGLCEAADAALYAAKNAGRNAVRVWSEDARSAKLIPIERIQA
ncbi:MAG: diguanylate cyclase [Pseudomonadota bacterium]